MAPAARRKGDHSAALSSTHRAPTAPGIVDPPRREEPEDDAELPLEELIAGDDDDLVLIASAIRRLSEAATGAGEDRSGRRRLGRLAFGASGRIIPELPDSTDANEVETALDEILRMRLGGASKLLSGDEGDGEEVVAGCGTDEFVCQACFLIKHRHQLADPVRAHCVDCAG